MLGAVAGLNEALPGATVNAVQRTRWGHLFNISELIGSIWVQLFEGQTHVTNGAVFFRVIEGQELPVLRELEHSGRIRLVREMVVEYHGWPSGEQCPAGRLAL